MYNKNLTCEEIEAMPKWKFILYCIKNCIGTKGYKRFFHISTYADSIKKTKNIGEFFFWLRYKTVLVLWDEECCSIY